MDKVNVVDKEYIDNANEAMAFISDIQHEQFGKELVLEDGRITGVITQFKEIYGK